MVDHFVGTYEVIAQTGLTVYRLNLLDIMKAYNIFHPELLKPFV